MPAFRPRIRALAIGVSAFALVAVAAGGTFAASNPATLYACYDAYGNVRMGDTAQCKLPGGGRLVTWSTAGVPGPTGATGPTGPMGPTGAQGPAGIGSASRIVTVPGTGVPQTLVTSQDITVSLICGGAFGRGLRIVAGAQPMSRTILIRSGDSFVYGAYDLPPGLAVENGTGEWVDVQAANASGGVHVTVTYVTGAAPGPCTFLAAW